MTHTDKFLPDTQIEILNASIERGHYHAALFDFDGTLSLIRQGWPQVMIPMMVDVLAEAPRAEPRQQLTEIVASFVMRLTGKQTIYQMVELAEQVIRRGGTPRDPLEYKHQYHGLLMEHIRHRREGLRSGQIQPADMLVPGSTEILTTLRDRGLMLYCASGTDRAFMHEEAELLGIHEHFDGGLYGALDDYKRFSKAILIQDIFRQHKLRGRELLAFGDGFVEIENTKDVGGTAVGVASDEARRQGIDLWKRDRLIRAGADIIIPHFRESRSLLKYLMETEP